MLTRKQHELLIFIQEHLSATGFSPSFDEMKIGLNLRSKSGIHRLITALEERGFLRRRAHRARALEIVRLPQDAIMRQETDRGQNKINIIHEDFTQQSKLKEAACVTLQVLGKIAAGQPIEPLIDNDVTIEVPESLLSSGQYYALLVCGDSMSDAGIINGDKIIIRRTNKAENGNIVVALIDKREVTLKKFRRRGNSIALEPANKKYETRIFGPNQVEIQGVLKGLMRDY